MPKRRKKSSNPVTPLLLILSFLIATLGVYSYVRFRPVGPAEIFLVEPVTLTEGPATLTGTITKDSPIGQEGSYLLILPTSQIILLDLTDLDPVVGLSASVTGTLNTAFDPPIMQVIDLVATE